MSWFADLNDNVLTPASDSISLLAGSYLTVKSTEKAGASAPSGAQNTGGVPNKNPSIFAGMGNSGALMIAGGLLFILVVMRLKR